MTARRRPAVLSLALFALLAVGAPRLAHAGDVEEAQKAARAAVVDRLADLAEWATSGQLWLQRTRVARAILRFDPNDPKALAWLKYEKTPDGTWRPPAVFSEPKDAAGTAFISGSKAFPDGPRALAMNCNSYWVPGARQVLIYSDDPRVREEWPARHPIGEFLYASVDGLEARFRRFLDERKGP